MNDAWPGNPPQSPFFGRRQHTMKSIGDKSFLLRAHSSAPAAVIVCAALILPLFAGCHRSSEGPATPDVSTASETAATAANTPSAGVPVAENDDNTAEEVQEEDNATENDDSSKSAESASSRPVTSTAWQAAERASDKNLNPLADGWESEAASEERHRLLKRFVTAWQVPGAAPAGRLKLTVSDAFECTALRPGDLSEVYRDAAAVVRKPAGDEGSPAEPAAAEYHGAAGLTAAVDELLAPFRGAASLRAHLKTVDVQLAESQVTTRHVLHLVAFFADKTIEQHAIWECRWRETAGRKPQIDSIRLLDFSEVEGYGRGGTWLSDYSAAIIGDVPAYREQLSYGTNHWMARLETRLGIDFYGHQGLALGDVNGDDLDDVYVCQPGGLPNRLFVRQRDGTVVDQSAAAGVDFLDATSSALLIDVDNDGDQDLVLAVLAEVTVLLNDGTGKFTRAAELPRGTTSGVYSLCAADYDSDGDLDVYVCRYIGRGGQLDVAESAASEASFIDANMGLPNVLLRNEGGGRFVDVTQEVGLDHNNRRVSFAAIWEDFDLDGDPDLYVANDFGRNNLYRNHQGKFVDEADAVGVEDMAAGMGVTCGDYDRDGDMDIYVANMFSAAGSRIASQSKFKQNDSAVTRSRFERFARGNSLYENLLSPSDSAALRFRDVSEAAAVTRARWAWSTLFVDFNNDGWEDLFVTNGMVTNKNSDDL
ncbi:MAG: VCBS repeat-containing protein [Planctomycetota bacterium]|nr:MAG: VCBS repeat-containing protein [Planctomycetota bacterium]REJ96902.1 MAG: VCBS repeat-containing protein [Planctomycetota bacterium]